MDAKFEPLQESLTGTLETCRAAKACFIRLLQTIQDLAGHDEIVTYDNERTERARWILENLAWAVPRLLLAERQSSRLLYYFETFTTSGMISMVEALADELAQQAETFIKSANVLELLAGDLASLS